MTDKRFNELLVRVTKAHGRYLKLLREAENEYLRRFGNRPGDVDDDWWIDSFEQCDTGSTLEDVTRNALRANN